MPEVSRFNPLPGSEHKTKNPVDDKEAQPCKNKIEPAQNHMRFMIHLSKTVMIDQQCHDLTDKKDPFDGPSKNKSMNQAWRWLPD